MRLFRRIAAEGAAAGVAFLAIACGNDSAIPTTPAPTPAAPTITERYAGTVGVGGTGFYSFSVTRFGTVNVTLRSISGVDGQGVAVGLALGVPAAFGCPSNVPVTASAGSDPQLTGVYEAGVYCVRLYDVGNLTGAATFDVTIAHP
jgi:hypothetical protein